jgi:filamentous hemagglutinin
MTPMDKNNPNVYGDTKETYSELYALTETGNVPEGTYQPTVKPVALTTQDQQVLFNFLQDEVEGLGKGTVNLPSDLANLVIISAEGNYNLVAMPLGDGEYQTLGRIPNIVDYDNETQQAASIMAIGSAWGGVLSKIKPLAKVEVPSKNARDELTGPYDPNTARADLEAVHGVDNVTSSTNPNNPLQRVNSNLDEGIEVITDSYGNKAVRIKFDDPVTGIPTSANIPYNNRGLPVFDDHAKYTTNIDKTKSYDAQFSQATRDLRDGINSGQVNASQFTALQLKQITSGKPKIKDFTWHHNADSGNMQLIPTSVHDAAKQIGQKALDKGM